MVATHPRPDSATRPRIKRVAVVNGSVDLLALIEPMLDPGDYDVQFLDFAESPYTHIRESHPDLVVLTLRIEDVESFNLLTMLKIDRETSDIQTITYSTEYEGQQFLHSLGESADDSFEASMPALPRN